MKTINNLFNEIISVSNLRLALHNAAKGKRDKCNVKSALLKEDEVVAQLHYELKNNLWRPKRIHNIKIINDGVQKKKREIVCPDFVKDQVVHHAIMQVCKPGPLQNLDKLFHASLSAHHR